MLLLSAVAPLVGLAAYWAVPMLASDSAVVFAEADTHIEQARRLFQQHRQNAEQLESLLSQLEHVGVDMAFDPERVDQLLEDRSILEAASESFKKLRVATAKRRRELDSRFLAAGGTEPPAAPRGFGNSLGQMRTAILSAVKQRDRLLKADGALLSEALTAVKAAMAVSKGDVTGAQHPRANRLKGMILGAQASASQRRAMRLRLQAEEPRRQIVASARRSRQSAVDRQVVETSGVRDQIETLQDALADARAVVATLTAKRAELDALIAGLTDRIAADRRTAQTARDAMERLADEGANLLDEQGAARFAESYQQHADIYRASLAEAHRLEAGTLTNARIDDSGDYLAGRFIPKTPGGAVSVQRGLNDYLDDRATVEIDLQRSTDMVTSVEANIAEFEAMEERFASAATAAKSRGEQARVDADKAYQSFVQYVDEADSALEKAAKKAGEAVRAFKAAVSVASTEAREAADRIAAASPAQQELSPFKLRSEDAWRAGQVNNEMAQAYYLLAEIRYDQFTAADEDSKVASIARSELDVSSADPEVFTVRAQEARQDGISAGRDAVRFLEKSSRPLNNNWTVAAQAGGAHYLLALLESPTHLQSAIDNYDEAIQGREDKPYTQTIVERLAQLRSR